MRNAASLLLCLALAPTSVHAEALVVAGEELLVVSLDDSMRASTLSPTLPLGGVCSEILPFSGQALVAYSGGLLRLVPSASANQAPELTPLLSGRFLDGIELDRDGSILALEHPREEHGEAVESHAVLRLTPNGEIDTVATASPAAYDLFLDRQSRRFYVTHLSGRTIETWSESNEEWRHEPDLRVEDPILAGKDEPRDDAFWLARLVFPTRATPWLLLEGRDVRPRLLAIEENQLRRLFAWEQPFLARNGAIASEGATLYLNAGRAIFIYDAKVGASRQVSLGSTPAIAVAASADGGWVALLFEESRERSVIEVWDAAMSRRALSIRVPGAARAIAFLER